MDRQTEKKVKIINKTIDSMLKSGKGLSEVTLTDVAKELSMPLSELTHFFQSVEDVFLNEQRRVNIKLEKYIDLQLEKAKNANEVKNILDGLLRKFVDILPKNSSAVLAATFYLPLCLKERKRAKEEYRKKLRKIIKKGWPGKVEHVLERQTDLVLLSIYGFYDYCSGLTSKERQVMLNDLSNMLNLHLQDRLFF